MNPLEEARAELEAKCDAFNRCANSTTPPGMLQQSVMDLVLAVNNWAELRRSGKYL